MVSEKTYKSRFGESKNVILVIAALLLVILAAGAVLVYILLQKGSSPVGILIPPSQNSSAGTNASLLCDDNCHYLTATTTTNFAACTSIINSSLRQNCYVALSNASFDACKLVLDNSTHTYCITAFARSMNDLSLCNQLGDPGSCQLAVDPCINNQNRSVCEAFYFNNVSKCFGNPDCVLNYSITTQNSSACAQISNDVIATACTASITVQDRCPSLGLSSKIDYCHELYAQYSNDYNICSKITGGTQYAVDCYSSFAVTKHSISVCSQDNLQVNDLWSCYTQYALGSGDVSGCTSIPDLASTSKFQCIFRYAKQYGNPSACDDLSDLGERGTCYQGAILFSPSTLNYSYCGLVKDPDWSRQCYAQSAKAQNNVSICNYIVSPDYARISCIDSYNLNKTK